MAQRALTFALSFSINSSKVNKPLVKNQKPKQNETATTTSVQLGCAAEIKQLHLLQTLLIILIFFVK